jgi:hypothetical protein
MKNKVINPYSCYILGFVVSLFFYLLGWSELYPTLSFSLLFFLIGTIAAHAFFVKVWLRKPLIQRAEILEATISPWLVTAFLYALWSIDFIYEGGIPLFKVLLNIPFDYKKFGFPSTHVLAVTFSSFYSVYLFRRFLAAKDKMILLLYLVNMAASILIYSRAMFFFNLASSAFLFLLSVEKIPYRKIALIVPVALVLFYLFGVAGTMRVSFEARSKYDCNLFLESAGATQSFRQSPVPKEFYWSYFYISSPVANLQLNVSSFNVPSITIARILEYINNELFFESASKRINKLFGVEREKEHLIREQFNVSTVYSRSYSYLGWIGLIAMATTILLIPLFYRWLLRNSPYALEGIAILCTAFLFMSYDNTVRLMATGFQLVYPIIYPMVEKKLLKLRTVK